jgi:MATE family multidrug resistance protein
MPTDDIRGGSNPTQTAPGRGAAFFAEFRLLVRLGGPIAIVQFGMTMLNVVDVAMLGRHDEQSLPAMALGTALTWGTLVFCMGVITAIDPLLAQAVGARDAAAIPRLLGRGALLAMLLSLPAALLLWPAEFWLRLFGQPEALLGEAAAYARLQAFGLLPFLWYSVLRSLLSAHARLLPQVLTIVVGNLLNLLLDWVLIHGQFGLPAMGATGASIATVLCRWWMLLALLWFGRQDILPQLRLLWTPAVRAAVRAWLPLWRLLRLGTPIGLQFLLEMGVFATTALLIGRFDAAAAATGAGAGQGPGLAGHQISLQLASLSFMVPLGLGMAASVRTGWAVGSGDQAALRRSVAAALGLATVVMTGFMMLFLFLPTQLAGLLTQHDPVLAMATTLIPIAGVFQIGDGVQVVAIGCLRGLGDVRSPVVANLFGFWLLGLPLGCWLCFGLDLGPAGLWWGLVGGLFAVALSLLYVLHRRLQERRERLRID